MSDMTLTGRMSLETNGAAEALKSISEKVSGAAEKLKAIGLSLTGLGTAFAAFKSTESVVEGFQAVFEKAHDLERAARQTGESIKDLIVISKAYKLAGMDSSVEAVTHSLSMLQRSLGGINEQGLPTKQIFDQLGLSVDKLQKMSASEQIEAIGERIRKLPNASQQAAAAMGLFGREGEHMLAILNDPDAMGQAIKSASALGDVYQRNAAAFAKVAVLVQSIQAKVGALFAGMAEQVAPAITPLLEQISKVDFLKWGEQLGQVIGVVAEAFREGKFGELLGASLKLGAIDAINFLSRALEAVMEGAAAALENVFDQLLRPGVFQSVGLGLLAGIAGIADKITALLLDVFRAPINFLQAGMEYAAQSFLNLLAKVPGLGDKLGIAENHRTFGEIYAERKADGPSVFGKSASDFSKQGDQYLQMAKDGLSAFNPGEILEESKKAFLKAFDGKDVIDATAAKSAFDQIYQALLKNVPKASGAEAAGAGPGAGLEALKIHKIDSDALAKVGGFVGGNGGPSLDYSRRTADSTTKTAAGIALINKEGVTVKRPITGEVSTWAS